MRQPRAYLDWNATTPLRAEAKAAMIQAMEIAGNPSSVHAEGRAAKGMLEKARGRIAEALGAMAADIVFVSGATEAAALALADRNLSCAGVEHDAVRAWCREDLPVDMGGKVQLPADPSGCTLQLANSETGVIQDLPEGLAVSDLTQGFGKVPVGFDWSGIDMGFVSAHKLGGPRGIGALVLRRGLDVTARLRGGGQEMGRRSGTENLIGIMGFAAAAEAAQRDLSDGVWEAVFELRKILESGLASANTSTIFVGKDSARLPNTSMIATPGWKGETQVMQMDLAGFAISAGSACSSGKVTASQVLTAMGYDAETAACAIRVSLGPRTTRDEVSRFVEAWAAANRRRSARA
ncbi:cysteine desulfurase family protein [Mangrovicoccus algicola]|uniref:Cysteine desulfurase n=1 Tax=Mangrovicoccus algicola TaxID=2771008 RepID=A0A8J7CUN2_9RHOB|nr:aminotransferase class V-fold PLP-dependent enzyme [Mangrovicoccus algicola]MBE3637724.1 aminotransferase class V-fold PLP-dependent enzyme [Mangrovicoccus algicola]